MEATIICIDNSEHTRNGDFAPTRFEAQTDAVNLLAGAVTEANAESSVGILTMAGKTPRVLVTLTNDLGKVLNSMSSVEIEGGNSISAAVQIAQLALKHRQNKNQRQRIVLFVGSPVVDAKETLVKIGKKLKKNNVSLDLVSFGAIEENQEKLDSFHGAVDSNGNSHMIPVAVGCVLSDVLIASPVFQGNNVVGMAGQEAGGGQDFPNGVNPEVDPDLALALQVSLEEERARQNAVQQAAQQAERDGDAAGDGAAAAQAADAGADADAEDMDMDDDKLLQQALALSLNPQAEEGEGGQQGAEGAGGSAGKDDEMLLDEAMKDPEMLKELVGELEGVDPSNPALQEQWKQLQEQAKGDKSDAQSKGDDKGGSS